MVESVCSNKHRRYCLCCCPCLVKKYCCNERRKVREKATDEEHKRLLEDDDEREKQPVSTIEPLSDREIRSREKATATKESKAPKKKENCRDQKKVKAKDKQKEKGKDRKTKQIVRDLRNERDQLQKRRNELERRLSPQNENPLELAKQRSLSIKDGVESSDFEKLYNWSIEQLLQRIEAHIHFLLQPTEEPITNERSEKEKYRVYGLLLSASIRDRADDHVLNNVDEVRKRINYDFIQEEHQSIIEENVRRALSLTRSMLTLLPPLLVTQPHWYREELQDTNRVTWNERKREPLIYYRPVLVYGNHIHVAIKGLVGNSETKLPDPADTLKVVKQPDSHHTEEDALEGASAQSTSIDISSPDDEGKTSSGSAEVVNSDDEGSYDGV